MPSSTHKTSSAIYIRAVSSGIDSIFMAWSFAKSLSMAKSLTIMGQTGSKPPATELKQATQHKQKQKGKKPKTWGKLPIQGSKNKRRK